MNMHVRTMYAKARKRSMTLNILFYYPFSEIGKKRWNILLLTILRGSVVVDNGFFLSQWNYAKLEIIS